MDTAKFLLAPLASVVDASSRAFWAYFLSYFIICYLIFKSRRVKQSFVNFLFPDTIYASRSFVINALYFCFITIFSGVLAAGMVQIPCLGGGPARAAHPGAGLFVLYSFLSLVVFDFLMFFTHFLQHKIGFLWRFHRFHHQPDKLDFFVAFRHHPVDIVLMSAAFLLAGRPLENIFPLSLEDNIFLLLFYLAGYHLRHSHIPLEYPRWLNAFLISPSDHQRHHDKAPEYKDRNLGFIFSVWDRFAGSYAPVTPKSGLGDTNVPPAR